MYIDTIFNYCFKFRFQKLFMLQKLHLSEDDKKQNNYDDNYIELKYTL